MDSGAQNYRRYLDGEETAFDAIIEELYSPLVFFLRRFSVDLDTAEDIAMDVFAELVLHPRRYNFKVSLKTYLFMLGRSRALNYIKRRKKLLPLSDAEHLIWEGPSLEELVLTDQRKRSVNRALAQLEENQRLAVHLVYFEQLSCGEAAKVMGKSTKQVYNLLYRAKQALRTILEEEDGLFDGF